MSRKNSGGITALLVLAIIITVLAISVTYYYFRWVVNNTFLSIYAKTILIISYIANILISMNFLLIGNKFPNDITEMLIQIVIAIIFSWAPSSLILLCVLFSEYLLQKTNVLAS